MPKRVEVGIVRSDKAAKTRRVEIPRQIRHPKYGKILHRKTVCHVHDEADESHTGDTVEIIECRPMSRLKRWKLVRVVEKSKAVDLAALRAAHREEAENAQS
jgi:small subunit ribosomal protein S17